MLAQHQCSKATCRQEWCIFHLSGTNGFVCVSGNRSEHSDPRFLCLLSKLHYGGTSQTAQMNVKNEYSYSESTFILILFDIYNYTTPYNKSASLMWTSVNYSARNIEKWKIDIFSVFLLTNLKLPSTENWGQQTLSVQSHTENILGLLDQDDNLKTLYRYLHNKRETKVSQNFMEFK